MSDDAAHLPILRLATVLGKRSPKSGKFANERSCGGRARGRTETYLPMLGRRVLRRYSTYVRPDMVSGAATLSFSSPFPFLS